MELSSTAFQPDAALPKRCTCEGDDLPPPLQWSGVPPKTASLALIVDDPDAPDPAHPQRTWVHWVVLDIPPETGALAGEGQPLPEGSREGVNDWKRARYGGPCPPIGRHRYFFKLYALDMRLPGLGRPTKAELEQAMNGHVLAEAVLMGTYQKQETSR
jgi:Raf kinase inhibitor-like YbhB/YbcL family protein